MIVLELKKALVELCSQDVEKRYLKIKQVIRDIEESLFEDSKSTSGDKHETGRAMLQIDRENAGRQLLEIENLQALVRKIDFNTPSNYTRLGSLVYTNHGTYFISISIGTVIVDKANYICVALHSPIGDLLSGKKNGESFQFNQKEYKISSVK